MTILLFVLAVIPPVYLAKKIYDLDKIEKEPMPLIRKLFILGAVSVAAAALLEYIMGYALTWVSPNMFWYVLLENFLGVALVEELCKYFVVRRCTWNDPEFDFRFDGIVYTVAASLGFAALENIMYVAMNGLGTAVVRALISIPGHCIFGIYMGVYYGRAKWHEVRGEKDQCRQDLRLAVLVPMLLHGFFDYCLSVDGVFLDNETASVAFLGIFLVYIIILDVVTIRKVRRYAQEDDQILPFSSYPGGS